LEAFLGTYEIHLQLGNDHFGWGVVEDGECGVEQKDEI
jgi:hypothetical protein